MSRTSTSGEKSRVERLKKFICVIVIVLLITPTVITCMVGIRFNRLRITVEEMASQSPVAMSIDNRNSIEILSSVMSELSATMAETNVKIQLLEEAVANGQGGTSDAPISAEDSATVQELRDRLASLEEDYKLLLEKFDALTTQQEQTGTVPSGTNYDEQIKALNEKIDALSASNNFVSNSTGNVDDGYLEGNNTERVEIPYTGK